MANLENFKSGKELKRFKRFIHGFKGLLEIRRIEKEMRKRLELKKTSRLRVIESSEFIKKQKIP